MKITILTTSFPEYPGDLAGVFVAHFAKELAVQGEQVTVIAPHSVQSSKREYLLTDTVNSVEVKRFSYMVPAMWQRVAYGHGLPTNLRSSLAAKVGLPFFLFMFLYAAFLERKHTDVYHAQWLISGGIALLIPGRQRKPLVLTIRGSDLNLLKGSLLRRLAAFILNHATLVTTVSERLREKVLALGVPPEKVLMIPNGIDSQRFSPKPQQEARLHLGLPVGRLLLLWIGRLVPIKGIRFLIEAMPDVLRSHPETMLVLVGTGEQEEWVQHSVRRLGLTDTVWRAGKVPSDQIPLWLNAADILVLPSLNEGRPNVVLEAMACELPVVATDVGGVSELIRHAVTGFLVPPKDAVALGQRVMQLLQNKHLRETMGKASRRRIFEMGLSWEQCVAHMRTVYRDAMRQEGA